MLKFFWCIILFFFSSLFPPNHRKKNPLIFKIVPSICDNWYYAVLWTPSSIIISPISHIYLYILPLLTLFHNSAIISTFPFANAFYIMILPQSITLYLIFWISVSIMWHDHFSMTFLTSLLQICTLDYLPNSKILFFHSFAQFFINYSVSLHTLVWCFQTHAIISNFISMQKTI